MPKKIKSVDDLTPDPKNANKGTERGAGLLENSLRTYGAGRSILADKNGLVIAGNKTLEKAAEIGLPVRVIETDGKELVVVQRRDLDLKKDKAAKELAIADNRVAQIDLEWDPSVLADMAADVDLAAVGFQDYELAALMPEDKSGEAGGDNSGGEAVIQYNIIFDDEGQQDRFFAFLRYLKGKYPTQPTAACRLDRFIQDQE